MGHHLVGRRQRRFRSGCTGAGPSRCRHSSYIPLGADSRAILGIRGSGSNRSRDGATASSSLNTAWHAWEGQSARLERVVGVGGSLAGFSTPAELNWGRIGHVTRKRMKHLLANIIRTANTLAGKSGSGQLLPDRTIRSHRYPEDPYPNRRKRDMRMLSRPLAPRGQEAAAFATPPRHRPRPTSGRRRPGGVAGGPIRPGAVGSPKTTAAPRGRTASVADQPVGE